MPPRWAALASLTREMASDFGRVGVRVNSIAPGEIDTSILSGTEKIVDQQIPLPAPAGHAGGGQDHLCAVHGNSVIRERRRGSTSTAGQHVLVPDDWSPPDPQTNGQTKRHHE